MVPQVIPMIVQPSAVGSQVVESGEKETWFGMEAREQNDLSLQTVSISYSFKSSTSRGKGAARLRSPRPHAPRLVHVRASSPTQHDKSAFLKAIKNNDISVI